MRKVKRHTIIQPVCGSYKIIPLTQNQETMVDICDYDHLMQWNWFAVWNRCTKSFYACRNNKRDDGSFVMISMQAQILGLMDGELSGDHKYGNTLDNRRSMLREADDNQQSANRRKRSDNSSGYKGVSFHKPLGKWRTQICIDRKVMHVGYYKTAEEAHAAYSKAAIAHFGEFARVA